MAADETFLRDLVPVFQQRPRFTPGGRVVQLSGPIGGHRRL